MINRISFINEFSSYLFVVFNVFQLDKTNQAKVSRLIDHMINLKSPSNAFSLFCESVDRWYKWLTRDLIADLKVERGEVKPRPETLEEAAVLVHRSVSMWFKGISKFHLGLFSVLQTLAFNVWNLVQSEVVSLIFIKATQPCSCGHLRQITPSIAQLYDGMWSNDSLSLEY